MAEVLRHEPCENFVMEIWQDDMAESPREWDNASVFICEHPSYILGDENGVDLLWEAITEHPRYQTEEYNDWEDEFFNGRGPSNDLEDLVAIIDKWDMHDRIYLMPLYLYDHSGISISTGPFACGWDSGMVGVAFVTMKHLKQIYGEGHPWYSEAMKERKCFESTEEHPAFRDYTLLKEGEAKDEMAKEFFKSWNGLANLVINCEVDNYDDFLRGNVFGFSLIKRVTDSYDGATLVGEEVIDSCGGFYGSDPEENGMIDHWDKDTIEEFRAGTLEIEEKF